MSRSIRNVRTSRRSWANSARSSVVSAPGCPRPASISACRTHSRSAGSVRSSSRATAPTVLPLAWTIRTASALNSFVNARRLRLALDYSYRTFVRSGVSTKPGEVHFSAVKAPVARSTGSPPVRNFQTFFRPSSTRAQKCQAKRGRPTPGRSRPDCHQY